MKLAYVCTNYNNSADTIAAIDSLLANPNHAYRCVVIDNVSRPEQKELLRSYAADRPWVDVIVNAENVGYFAGLNVGLEHLRRTAPDYVHAVVGNNDLHFPLNFADAVAAQIALFEIYPVVSPSIVTADGEYQNPHVVEGISPLRERLYDLYFANYHLGMLMKWLNKGMRGVTRRGDEDQRHAGREIAQGHGSCYLFGPRFFVELRTLWAPTFLFGEEYFLSLQLAEKGFKVYFEPSIAVTHVSHATVGKLPSRHHWELMKQSHKHYRQHKPI